MIRITSINDASIETKRKKCQISHSQESHKSTNIIICMIFNRCGVTRSVAQSLPFILIMNVYREKPSRVGGHNFLPKRRTKCSFTAAMTLLSCLNVTKPNPLEEKDGSPA